MWCHLSQLMKILEWGVDVINDCHFPHFLPEGLLCSLLFVSKSVLSNSLQLIFHSSPLCPSRAWRGCGRWVCVDFHGCWVPDGFYWVISFSLFCFSWFLLRIMALHLFWYLRKIKVSLMRFPHWKICVFINSTLIAVKRSPWWEGAGEGQVWCSFPVVSCFPFSFKLSLFQGLCSLWPGTGPKERLELSGHAQVGF